MVRILIVCTANICRSPVVAALLQRRLHEQGYEDWVVESAGTWAMVARSAARFSVQLMNEQGLDISQHQARMVDAQFIAQSDLVLCMELGHVEALQIEFPTFRKRIYALSNMVGKRYSIADPYGGTLTDYRDMVREVTQLIDAGFSRIVTLAEANHQRRNP